MERDFKILPSLNVIFDLNENVIKIVSGNLMNVFIYGNAQIDEDSLIGINEGIEKLTLTLLIGIKADLLQFIYILIGY